jgi:clan AA aspartic protease
MNRIKLYNIVDLANARSGLLRADQVRSLEVEAFVDTGATMLALPQDVASVLGLPQVDRRNVRLADGSVREVDMVGDLRVEILGRSMACDALVLPVGATTLIGQMQLEALDLIVDAKSRSVAVNPASPDTPLLDLLRVS